MTQDRRRAVVDKIKALLSKTVKNGCTPGEMEAALMKARELMAAYEVDETDLTFDGEQVEMAERQKADRHHIRNSLCAGVALFCECQTWRSGFEKITFCGLESDTIFAHWLLDTLTSYVERELVSFLSKTSRPGAPRVRKLETNGFIVECCNRISKRLAELSPKRSARGTGRDLVTGKAVMIAAAMKKAGINVRCARKRIVNGDLNAARAGRAAGDRATFSRPVNGGAGVRAIGAH